MTALTSTQFVVNPGRWDDATAVALEVSKLLDRHGARETRLFVAGAAGEATGACLFLAEYENAEALGAASDELNAGVEFQTVMARLRGPDSPVIITGQNIVSEIPLPRESNTQRGQILETHVSQIVPGRLEQLVELSTKCAEFVEANGATHATLASVGASGTFTNAISMSWELPDMKAWGRLADAWLADPAGLEIYQAVYGDNPPSTEVFTGIYRVVPI